MRELFKWVDSGKSFASYKFEGDWYPTYSERMKAEWVLAYSEVPVYTTIGSSLLIVIRRRLEASDGVAKTLKDVGLKGSALYKLHKAVLKGNRFKFYYYMAKFSGQPKVNIDALWGEALTKGDDKVSIALRTAIEYSDNTLHQKGVKALEELLYG